jgi:hypothetical protein
MRRPAWTARVFLLGALFLFAAYAATELWGLRETTRLLTGLDAFVRPRPREVAELVVYLASYFLAVFVAPVLLLAGLLRGLLTRKDGV